MLDYTTINDIRTRATNRAVRRGLKPCSIDTALINILHNGGTGDVVIPFLGDYCPLDWRPAEQDDEYIDLFVDSSGWGSPGEPALTLPQLAQELKQYNDGNHGIAIIESGQFQVYLRIYVRK